MSERDRDLIRDVIMFAVKDISGRVLREAAVQSMIDDFIKEYKQNLVDQYSDMFNILKNQNKDE